MRILLPLPLADAYDYSVPEGLGVAPGQFVVVPDKGMDRTFVFRFEGGRITPTAQGFATARPGAAPPERLEDRRLELLRDRLAGDLVEHLMQPAPQKDVERALGRTRLLRLWSRGRLVLALLHADMLHAL